MRFKYLWLENRAMLLRSIAAIFFWGLLILCFIFSVSARNYTENTVRVIGETAVTPAVLALEQNSIEIAKTFLKDYLTFSADYSERMKKYGNYPTPVGQQKVNDVYVLHSENIDGIYRIYLTASLQRLSSTNNSYGINVVEYNEKDEVYYYWQNIDESYMVSVYESTVLGTPVIQALATATGQPIKMNKGSYTADYQVFAQQVLEHYFEGKDLKNYTNPETRILSIGGYKVNRLEILGYEQNLNFSKALIKTNIQSGLIQHEQMLILEAEHDNNNWLLSRIGTL